MKHGMWHQVRVLSRKLDYTSRTPCILLGTDFPDFVSFRVELWPAQARRLIVTGQTRQSTLWQGFWCPEHRMALTML